MNRELIVAIYSTSTALTATEVICKTAQAKIARIFLGWEFPATDKFMISWLLIIREIIRIKY